LQYIENCIIYTKNIPVILQQGVYRGIKDVMILKEMGDIFSGYITRGKIDAAPGGSHYLMQAKDVDGTLLRYQTDQLIRFEPNLSRSDRCLQRDDLLFMAKGAHNFTLKLDEFPEPALAAACFFIIRLSSPEILPAYVGWYLNQAPVAQYLVLHSGRGVHMPVVRRAVLENIDVPVPSLTVQTTIAEMNALLSEELDLLQRLGRKRSELATAACLEAIRRHG
jgi:hypothetical protein